MPSPTKKPWWRRAFGTQAERAAAQFLRRQGYRILAQNFTCPLGELDLVAVDKERCVVFVEVRSTQSGESDQPAASVDAAKQKRLTRLALHYLKTQRLLECSARFDVIAISWPPENRQPQIEHFRSAFEASDRFQFFS